MHDARRSQWPRLRAYEVAWPVYGQQPSPPSSRIQNSRLAASCDTPESAPTLVARSQPRRWPEAIRKPTRRGHAQRGAHENRAKPDSRAGHSRAGHGARGDEPDAYGQRRPHVRPHRHRAPPPSVAEAAPDKTPLR